MSTIFFKRRPTVGEAVSDLAEDEGQVFGACAEEHADEYGVDFDGGAVHGRPRDGDDRLYECSVRPLETRHDMGQRRDPET
jgi:hypothetical protein